MTNQLSLVAAFDDLQRSQCILLDSAVESEVEFLRYVRFLETYRLQTQEAVEEARRIQKELQDVQKELSNANSRLRHAQKMLDAEKRKTAVKTAEANRWRDQIHRAGMILFSDECNAGLNNDTLSKLAFLNAGDIKMSNRLDPIAEADINTTGTLISDLSYSRSGDDLDKSRYRSSAYRKHGYSGNDLDESVEIKRRRSSGRMETNCNTSSSKVVEINNTDKVIATTTVTVPKDGMGPIIARSVIEAVPEKDENVGSSKKSSARELFAPTAPLLDCEAWTRDASPSAFSRNLRPHCFIEKTTMLRSEPCGGCNKRIRFGKAFLKCKECKAVSHLECKDLLPLPCVPVGNTPTMKGTMGTIADYTPNLPPMVPAIVVHCVNEVESRGLEEVGIYRVPGSEKEVKGLKERFLRGKGVPNLTQLDIHVICGCLKDFLRSLKEPLITKSLWSDFVHAVEDPVNEGEQALYRAVSDLPQPNRDTLAFLVMHLQRVADCREVKMPIGNIAKIFGPTVVGYSSLEPNPATLLTETRQQVAVMESLLNIPTDYWAMYTCFDLDALVKERVPHAASTDSLPLMTPNKYFSTPSEGRKHKRTRRPLY